MNSFYIDILLASIQTTEENWISPDLVVSIFSSAISAFALFRLSNNDKKTDMKENSESISAQIKELSKNMKESFEKVESRISQVENSIVTVEKNLNDKIVSEARIVRDKLKQDIQFSRQEQLVYNRLITSQIFELAMASGIKLKDKADLEIVK